MSQTCPYCRESIAASDLTECPACHTPHHQDCWMENGGCTVFGCERTPTDDPKIAISPLELAGSAVHGVGGPSAGEPVYFVARNGQQQGPYSLEQLRLETGRGVILRDDLAWTAGLAEWVPLSRMLGTLPEPASPHAAPYAAPTTPTRIALNPARDDPCAGRMQFGRGIYFLSLMAIFFVAGILQNSRDTQAVGIVFLWVASLSVGALRARDVGMSGWSVLLTFIPIANIVIGFRLLLAPRGYAITRQADTVLRVFTWVFVAVLVLVVVAFIIGLMNQH